MIESFVTMVVVKMATMVFVDTVVVTTSCQRNDTPAVYNAVIVVIVVDVVHIVSLSHTENDVVAF